MMRLHRLTHEFVQHLPERLEPGVLYVSVEYALAAHCCCCGCGEQIVTTFTPARWRMTFNGDSVSLWPSIGNWNYPCRSHYIIDQGRVREAEMWTDDEVAAGRHRDRVAADHYYEALQPTALPLPLSLPVSVPIRPPVIRPPTERPNGWWVTLRRRLLGSR